MNPPEEAISIADQAPAVRPEALRLKNCPQCGYLLAGLPANHRCPECSFAYDEWTFQLVGIARGNSGMSQGRRWIAAFVITAGSLGVMFGPIILLTKYAAYVIGGFVLWLTATAYLILTSQGGRRGIETFLFSAEGFGYCGKPKSTALTPPRMTPWSQVDRVVIDQKGASWHRIRIGCANARGRVKRVCFDAGVRCDAPSARWIDEVLSRWIAATRDGQPASLGVPANCL